VKDYVREKRLSALPSDICALTRQEAKTAIFEYKECGLINCPHLWEVQFDKYVSCVVG
jgi:hypothetical protein